MCSSNYIIFVSTWRNRIKRIPRFVRSFPNKNSADTFERSLRDSHVYEDASFVPFERRPIRRARNPREAWRSFDLTWIYAIAIVPSFVANFHASQSPASFVSGASADLATRQSTFLVASLATLDVSPRMPWCLAIRFRGTSFPSLIARIFSHLYIRCLVSFYIVDQIDTSRSIVRDKCFHIRRNKYYKEFFMASLVVFSFVSSNSTLVGLRKHLTLHPRVRIRNLDRIKRKKKAICNSFVRSRFHLLRTHSQNPWNGYSRYLSVARRTSADREPWLSRALFEAEPRRVQLADRLSRASRPETDVFHFASPAGRSPSFATSLRRPRDGLPPSLCIISLTVRVNLQQWIVLCCKDIEECWIELKISTRRF